MCDKNISIKKYEKFCIENEELSQIFLEKGLFASIKGYLCLSKGHLDYPEENLEIEYPLT